MKKLLLILLMAFGYVLKAQYTPIPDSNFEQALINLGYDSGPLDGAVLTANISTVTAMDISAQNISDLTGIQDFIAMDSLSCHLNQLSGLDVSNLTMLNFFDCSYNQLECLNIKNGTNTNLTTFYAHGNPNLSCIEVDNVVYSFNTWTPASWNFNVDPSVNFSTNCGVCTVGINEKQLTGVTLFPNPSSGNISVELGQVVADLRIRVINNLGQVVLAKKYTSTDKISLELNAPKGIYFLQLSVQDELIIRKIIKD